MPRPRKPVEIKRATGNPGKRKLPEPSAIVPALEVVPDPPAGLALAGTGMWRLAWDAGASWLCPADSTLVEMLCRQMDEVIFWRGILDTEGITFTTKNGFVRIHPAVGQIRVLEERIASNLGLLGFTPADRSRLGLTEVRKLTGLADLAQRRHDVLGR